MAQLKYDKNGRLLFTKEMKQDYTILFPNMAPIHFNIFRNVLCSHGYRAVLLENQSNAVVENGLKYVHNDTCYPALLVIGQMIDALSSGKYDPNRTALLITQTGGGCRASNYIHLLRKALQRAGYPQVPVISMNISGLERNSGFSMSLTLLRQLMAALVYGDMLMLLANQTRPYERQPGATDALVKSWCEKLCRQMAQRRGYDRGEITLNLGRITRDFNDIAVNITPKIKVGIVGEIYVKYSSLGNNDLEALLAREDCEVMLPGILNFVMYCLEVHLDDIALYGGSKIKAGLVKKALGYLFHIENAMIEALKPFPRFHPPTPFRTTKALAKNIIGYGCKMGEGWLLTAEMAELVQAGYGNIICTQPFGCLPNHIAGKGMIRKLKTQYPTANIVPIDYDPSATGVNQENRIKLMLSIAREELAKQQAPKTTPPPMPAKTALNQQRKESTVGAVATLEQD